MSEIAQALTCKLCRSSSTRLVEALRRKPPGETDFGVRPEKYVRDIWKCENCSVYFSCHELFDEQIYQQEYNRATYQQNLLSSYQRIRALAAEASDNKQRVRRVANFDASRGGRPESSTVLDVGTGLCVFLAEMKDIGYTCHAIDPDPVAAEHARTNAGVDHTFAGTLESFPAGEPYELITFNKVLEHIVDPITVLSIARQRLRPGGFIYLELPDGDAALAQGTVYEREEFYIEHETIFTEQSLRHLAQQADLHVADFRSIHEPSDKYTAYAFCTLTGE